MFGGEKEEEGLGSPDTKQATRVQEEEDKDWD